MKKFLIFILIILVILLFVLIGVRGIVEDMDFLDEFNAMGEQLTSFDDGEYSGNNYTNVPNNTTSNTPNSTSTSGVQTVKVNDGGGIGFYGKVGTEYAGKEMTLFFDGTSHSLTKKDTAAKWKIDLDGFIVDTLTETFVGDDLTDKLDYLDKSSIIKEVGVGDKGISYVLIERK